MQALRGTRRPYICYTSSYYLFLHHLNGDGDGDGDADGDGAGAGDGDGDVDGDGDGDGDEDGDSGLEDGNDEFIDFEDDRSVFGVGVGVFLGADYYIIPKVYIGVEMGYGLRVLSSDDFTSWGLGGGVNGMMRVGFRL